MAARRMTNIATESGNGRVRVATVSNVMVLGLIVLIRTFLSTALQLEVESRRPWQRAESRSRDCRRRAGEPARVILSFPEFSLHRNIEVDPS